jgi:HEPN domain-containing protein
MKQTAVEWLVYVVQSNIAPNYIPKEIIKQAKEMEKQHIIDAWTDAKYCNTMGNEINYEDGEQYYNETFNK